jgi:hypothetical protein
MLFESDFCVTYLGFLFGDFFHLPRLSPPSGPSQSYFNLCVTMSDFGGTSFEIILTFILTGYI